MWRYDRVDDWVIIQKEGITHTQDNCSSSWVYCRKVEKGTVEKFKGALLQLFPDLDLASLAMELSSLKIRWT